MRLTGDHQPGGGAGDHPPKSTGVRDSVLPRSAEGQKRCRSGAGTASAGVRLLSDGPGATSSPRRFRPGHGMPGGGVWPHGGRWSWVLPVGRDPRTESTVRSGVGSPLLLPTAKQQIEDTSGARQTRIASGQRQQRPGTVPSTQQSSSHCWGAGLWGGHRVRCWRPAPPPLIATGACEVGELQETRMLNYRAALETSNSSGTVARRGGSRAVNRNCGGSRGEQSEGSFCACIAPSPSLPLSFSHLSRPPRPPARTGVREAAPRRGWEAAAPEAEEPPWVEKGVCKVSSIRGHLPWKCARVKGPLWPARRPRQDGHGAKSPRLPTSEEAVGCQMSVFLPGVKPLLSPPPRHLRYGLFHSSKSSAFSILQRFI